MQKELYFITENEKKIKEIQALLPYVKQMNLGLPEIQENNSKKIIEEKLKTAHKLYPNLEFIVDDTSLYFDALNGLPGPLIKWFLEKNSLKELYNICDKLKNYNAQAKTIIGYKTKEGKHYFFEGLIEGKIVSPTIDNYFSWDAIFKPNGYELSFAEMTLEEKNKISMRKKAIEKLKEFLENDSK
ncbi:non-canonical purine NTP pyrophosphatase [archaeon]|nr:non-canonical purine NTP pyrophosphatase [archaeon]